MKLSELKDDGTVSVMYHYVRDNEVEGTPNLKSLDFQDFVEQLDWLQANFSPLSIKDYYRCIEQNIPFPNNTFVLTFDDGLKDHYKYVFSELKKRGLFGFFFINSGIYDNSFPLGVHIVHFILDKIGVEAITKLISKEMENLGIDIPNEDLDDVYRYDDLNYSHIKKILNYTLDYKVRDQLLRQLFNNHFGSVEDFIQEVYLSKTEIKEMIEGGMVFGNHTHSHKVLSRLTRDEQWSELQKCNQFLESNFGIQNPSFCYPYGHHHTFNGITIEVLNDLGLHSGFTTKRSTSNPTTYGKFMIQRFDTVDILKLQKESA